MAADDPRSLSPATGAERPIRSAWPALAGLAAVFLIEMLDNSLLTVALPTIARELRSSTTGLQWISGAYSVTFGGLMLIFGAVADRVGRRRVMLAGLVLLTVASLSTAAVTSTGQLIAVRALMGVAAAMTTPGTMALAFRMFGTDELRVRALTIITTGGLVGLALGPTLGGLALAVAPWQVLLLVNVPIAVLAFAGIRSGVAADDRAGLHRRPMTVRDLRLLAVPAVASGLVFKAAASLAVAALGYLATLQLQFVWGWPPALAAIGILPQVVVLLAGGRLVGPVVQRLGLGRAAWAGAVTVVSGLAVFGLVGRFGYGWVVVSLVLVAAGMRVVGVVAGTNVLGGLPPSRTSMGAALVDTSGELATAVGLALVGTVLGAAVPGSIAGATTSATATAQLASAVAWAGLAAAAVAAGLVAAGLRAGRTSAIAP